MDEGSKRGRLWMLWVVGLVVALGVSFVFVARVGKQAVEQPLPDGSTLRLEGVTLGSSHSFSKTPVRYKLQQWLPTFLKSLIGKPGRRAQLQTPRDSLVIWTTRVKTGSPGYNPSTRQERYYVVDSHGCRFRSNLGSISMGSTEALVGMAFEAFPRGEKTFQMIICDTDDNVITQVTIENRFRTKPQRWSPEPLPITKTNGGLVAQLRRLRRWDSIDSTMLRPEVTLVRPLDGEVWNNGPVWICDRFGNRSLQTLCTNESFYKVEAHFFRRARATFRPDEIWTITNVTIPPPGQVALLRMTNTLQGVTVVVEALKGADDGSTIPSDPLMLLLRSTQFRGETKILVRARDNTGQQLVVRSHYQLPRGFTYHANYLNQAFDIYPLPDSKLLDIEVLVQKPTKFEFFVEPPR